MKRTAFDILNKEFEEKTPDPKVFDAGEFNLIKIYQHALFARINKVPLNVRPFWKLPRLVHQFVLFLKRLKNKTKYTQLREQLGNIESGKTLLYAGGNMIQEDGKDYCITVERIIRSLGKENTCFIFSNYQGRNAECNQDFDIDDLRLLFENTPYQQEELELINQIKSTRSRLEKSSLYQADLEYFDQYIQMFLINFKVWNRVLKFVKPKNAFISTHYHNEAIVAALKHAKIQVCELQHGLISSNDLYYCYKQNSISEIKNRMLLADKILVFGKHWKKTLSEGHEFSDEQILISGNHIFRPEIKESELDELRDSFGIIENKAILIAAQKRLAKQFASYISMLSEKLQQTNPEYRIIIKPHPGQAQLELLTNCAQKENVFMAKKTDSIHALFSICKHQVSIYSTTFYDAIGFDIQNHSIVGYPETDNFALEMIEKGVANKLELNASPLENPIDKNTTTVDSRDYYYEDFNEDLIQQLI